MNTARTASYCCRPSILLSLDVRRIS